MSMELAFNGIQFEIISRNGHPWVTARQLAQALGYAREDSVLKIYERNKDEFSSMMSATVKMTVGITEVMVRIFSMRGCWLVSMLSRTPVAKQFRRWVLDVLDKLAEEERAKAEAVENTKMDKFRNLSISESTAPDAPLTPDQQCTLQALVKARVESIPKAERPKGLYPQIWSRFNNHFRIARYCQLPQSRLSEAIEYLTRMDLAPALPASAPLPAPKQDIVPVPCEGKLPTAFFDIRADESTDDKYHAYLEQVEAWRIATITERDRLSHAGMELFEFDRVGRVIFEAGAAFIDDWLNRVALSSISVFDPLLRSCRAPVILARHLNAKFESVSAARKAGLKFV